MLPVTNSYWFRESYLSKFCFIIICEERKQKVLILNSSEKFIIFFSKYSSRAFQYVGACWLKYVDHIVLFSLFTKICQMKSCQKWNVHFCSFEI